MYKLWLPAKIIFDIVLLGGKSSYDLIYQSFRNNSTTVGMFLCTWIYIYIYICICMGSRRMNIINRADHVLT